MSDELKPLSFGSDPNNSNFSSDFSIPSKSSYNSQEAEEFVPLRNTQNIEEIKNQDIVSRQLTSDFLQDYGPFVQNKIEDEKLRNWNPAMD